MPLEAGVLGPSPSRAAHPGPRWGRRAPAWLIGKAQLPRAGPSGQARPQAHSHDHHFRKSTAARVQRGASSDIRMRDKFSQEKEGRVCVRVDRVPFPEEQVSCALRGRAVPSADDSLAGRGDAARAASPPGDRPRGGVIQLRHRRGAGWRGQAGQEGGRQRPAPPAAKRGINGTPASGKHRTALSSSEPVSKLLQPPINDPALRTRSQDPRIAALPPLMVQGAFVQCIHPLHPRI